MHPSSLLGWAGRFYLLALLVLAVVLVAWSLDTYVLTGTERSIWRSIAAAVVVFAVFGWAFRRASR